MKGPTMNHVYAALLWTLATIREYPAISTPILGALFTLIFKPRTPAQYAAIACRNPVWFFSRLAAMLQLIGALFPDTQKAAKVLMKVITGKQDSDLAGPPQP
jgi:hypothetical protein